MNIFELKPKLYLSKNAIWNLKHELESQSFKKVFIIVSNRTFHSLALKETLMILKQKQIEYFIYQINNNHVESEDIYEASELFLKKKSDLIIAIGGGNVINFSKTLGIYTPNKSLHHSVWHYVTEPSVLKSISYPIVVIPTNWSNSSCSNGLSIIYNSQMNLAQAVISITSIPSVIIADYKYALDVLTKDKINDSILFNILDCINNILNNNNQEFLWTKNYNYANLISLIKAGITIKNNPEYEESYNVLIANNYFNGSNLDKYDIKFDYDLLSLFLGINGIIHWDFCLLMNELIFIYWENKKNVNQLFLNNVIELNYKIFNKKTSDLNLLKQFLISKAIYNIQNNLVIENDIIANQMIQNAIIQYQKNYLDSLDINKEEYKMKQDMATSLFTKIIYNFVKKDI